MPLHSTFGSQHLLTPTVGLDHAYQQQYRLNELKDHFIQNVSHELRTPLTEVYGFLQLLHEHQGQLEISKQAFFLEQALHGCEELLSLFTTILEASQTATMVKSLKLEKLALYPIIEHVLAQCDPHERKEHPIRVEVPMSFVVQADGQYVRQVLRNLLTNAFKYTTPQTPILLRAERHVAAQQTLSERSYVYIRVQDTGPGIPPEEQEMLFQQFIRLKRDLSGNVRGTGLGLYLSRQFVEAMGGRIWVESSGIAGEGSCFCFTLPAASSVPEDLNDAQDQNISTLPIASTI